MKKSLFFMLFIFSLVSCDSEIVGIEEKSNERLEQVLDLKGDSQRLAYLALSSSERLDIWKLHFEQMKESNNYSENKIQFIDEIYKLLNEKYFEKGNVEFVNFSKYVKIKGLKYFETKELFELIGSLGGNQMKYDQYPLGNCSCNVVDDWCFWGSSCYGNAFCKYSVEGCGTFLQEPCQGVCQSNN